VGVPGGVFLAELGREVGDVEGFDDAPVIGVAVNVSGNWVGQQSIILRGSNWTYSLGSSYFHL